MAVCGVHRQPCTKADDKIYPDIGLYDYVADMSTYEEYAECLGVGNFYSHPDSLDGFNVAASDDDTTVAGAQDDASSSQTTKPVVYPWMKRRQRRNGRLSICMFFVFLLYFTLLYSNFDCRSDVGSPLVWKT